MPNFTLCCQLRAAVLYFFPMHCCTIVREDRQMNGQKVRRIVNSVSNCRTAECYYKVNCKTSTSHLFYKVKVNIISVILDCFVSKICWRFQNKQWETGDFPSVVMKCLIFGLFNVPHTPGALSGQRVKCCTHQALGAASGESAWSGVKLVKSVIYVRKRTVKDRGCRRLLTWCCTRPFHPSRSSGACCPWWRRGSWRLSHWRRTGRASRWNPAWTGPGPVTDRGTRCRPAWGRSIFASGRCLLCSPAEPGWKGRTRKHTQSVVFQTELPVQAPIFIREKGLSSLNPGVPAPHFHPEPSINCNETWDEQPQEKLTKMNLEKKQFGTCCVWSSSLGLSSLTLKLNTVHKLSSMCFIYPRKYTKTPSSELSGR